MTIEKHGNKWRISETYKGKRYRISLDYKPTKHEAELLIHDKIQSADFATIANDSFKSAALSYITGRSNTISPSTDRAYRSILANLSDNFLAIRIPEMTQIFVQKEINHYSATHSPKSTRNAHGFISAVLREHRPSMQLYTTLPQKVKFEPYTPTGDDIDKVLEYVSGGKYEIPYRLACYGLRRSEICALTSADLDGNLLTICKAKVQQDGGKWVIKPTPKTYESNRTIAIDSYLAELIANKDGYLFDGYPNRLNDHLKEIQKRLGLPRFRFHDMRAYFASKAHAIGIPDKYIMANGGWSSDYILKRVYRRTMDDVKNEMNMKYASLYEKK